MGQERTIMLYTLFMVAIAVVCGVIVAFVG